LRVPTNYRRDINGFRLASLQGGNNFKPRQYRLNLGRVLWLRCTNDNVFTSLTPSAALVEHLKGFANPSGIAEENFQFSTSLPTLLELDMREQLLWAGSLR
jgi:hypothetical protein